MYRFVRYSHLQAHRETRGLERARAISNFGISSFLKIQHKCSRLSVARSRHDLLYPAVPQLSSFCLSCPTKWYSTSDSRPLQRLLYFLCLSNPHLSKDRAAHRSKIPKAGTSLQTCCSTDNSRRPVRIGPEPRHLTGLAL